MTFIIYMAYVGGVSGSFDAGSGIWRSTFWPYYACHKIGEMVASMEKDGGK